VRRILKNNPTALSTPDHLGNTSLHLAASQGHLDIVQYFVDELLHEVDGISRNNLGDTPLIVAAAAGHEDVVRYLAERFGEEGVDCGNWLGVTPLMAASREGREGCVLVSLFARLL
jgi:ankyrin repeat protein